MLKGYTNRRTVGGIGKNQSSESFNKGTPGKIPGPGIHNSFDAPKNFLKGSYPARTGILIPGHFSVRLPGIAVPSGFLWEATNQQLARGTLVLMAKRTSASEPPKRPYKTTGLHLPADLWELLNRLAFERARTKGGRASASAIIVELIERHRKELEKELASASR
jgi:predicted DNA-binding protein